MAELIEPRLGLKYGWNLGESEFKTGMDLNLIMLSGIYALSVISRTQVDPPVSPVNGDVYIPGPSATGAWLTYDGDIAYYVANGWRFYTPAQGWKANVEDEGNCTIAYTGAAWSDDMTLPEGGNIVLGTVTGSQIATGPTQKMAAWGATPVVQPASANQAAVTPVNVDGAVGALTISATYSQLEVQALRDAVEVVADDMRANNVLLTAIRDAQVVSGFIKGSA